MYGPNQLKMPHFGSHKWKLLHLWAKLMETASFKVQMNAKCFNYGPIK